MQVCTWIYKACHFLLGIATIIVDGRRRVEWVVMYFLLGVQKAFDDKQSNMTQIVKLMVKTWIVLWVSNYSN